MASVKVCTIALAFGCGAFYGDGIGYVGAEDYNTITRIRDAGRPSVLGQDDVLHPSDVMHNRKHEAGLVGAMIGGIVGVAALAAIHGARRWRVRVDRRSGDE